MQFPQYDFDFPTVESAASPAVREALVAGHGLSVVGRPGVGKTHAVAQAVNGALWSTVPDTPYAVPRVLADLAAQARAPQVLSAYHEQGCDAACKALDDAIGSRVLVLDMVEHLWSVRSLDPFDEPDVSVLWSEEIESMRAWARCRVEDTPTILIGRWHAHLPHMYECKPPGSWIIKLQKSDPGFVPWRDVADLVATNPAGLELAAATLRLAGPQVMRTWLAEASGSAPRDAVTALARHFRQSAPEELIRLLAALASAGDVERVHLDHLADELPDVEFALDLAGELRLLEERGGVVRLGAPVRDALSLPSPHDAGVEPLLQRLATRLLAGINDRHSLEPAAVRRVLDAHRLQLAVGDFQGALTTARHHLGGLVAHARSLSLAASTAPDFDRARRAYGDIRSLLARHPRFARTHVASYVSHYHGYNGHRARTLSLDEVATDYEGAIDAWPENALWHARFIALEAETGNARGAMAAMHRAQDLVPDHERKDTYLRIRAARWCADARADSVAFELLEGYEPPANLAAVDLIASQYLRHLWRQWARGVARERLSDGAGSEVVFNQALRVALRADGPDRWSASLDFPPLRATGPGPASATRSLASALATECVRLVQTPTARLSREDVARKGLFLGVIDLASSQLGLRFHSHRWLLGTVTETEFTPTQVDLDPIPFAPGIQATTHLGRFLALVPVDRTGYPNGPVERLVEAGSGRNLEELLVVFKRLAEAGDEAA